MSKTNKTLVEADIQIDRKARRRFLGVAAAGGLSVLIPTQAQAADGDTGSWTDGTNCPRGSGGTRTRATDSDNGTHSDSTNYGRGRPNRC